MCIRDRPGALETLNLSEYDLVISSEAGPAKGIIAPPNAAHLCYCHSPMRYLWDQYHVYKSGAGLITKIAMPIFSPRLRQWDVTSAARVDKFISNSAHVAKRVKKYWRRDSGVVYPPVSINEFYVAPKEDLEPYYLWAGELVSYKRPDILVEAFNKNGKPLVVIGGPEKTVKSLKMTAKENIKFLGKVDFKTLKHHMSRCKALIFPGEEDFGMVPVEVMASGRPVIAYGRGGALETVVNGITGMFYKEQSADALNHAIDEFETNIISHINPTTLIEHVKKFSPAVFEAQIATNLKDLGLKGFN